MRRVLLLLGGIVLLCRGTLVRSMPPAEAADPAAATAAAPWSNSVPEVAAARLRATLAQATTTAEWQGTALKLVEALVAAQQPADAIKLLDDPRFAGNADAKFWRAQTLASMQRWNEALPIYRELATAKSGAHVNESIFGAAEMLRALGRTDEALRAVSALNRERDWKTRAQLRSAELYLDKGDWTAALHLLEEMKPAAQAERREARFLRARVELARGRPERALGTFESIVKKPDGAGHPLVLAALFGVADAHLLLKSPESGDDVLEDFIDRRPNDPELSRIFAKLDQLYRAERKPARVELEKWTREPEQPRRTLAQWYLAQIELRASTRPPGDPRPDVHHERALSLLAEARKAAAKVPEAAPALLDYARLLSEDGHFEDALGVLDEARALRPDPALLDRLNILAGEVHYAARQFQPAADRFAEVARSTSPYAKTAAYNESLGLLQLGDQARFIAVANELAAPGGDQSDAGLQLDQGLVQAAKGDKNAAETLQKFLRQSPQSPRAAEAWVALAELAFHATPPRLDDARKDLEKARQSNPTPAATERGDYLGIWIEDAQPGNDERLIEVANKFLTDHPESSFASDVRMKVAEAYFRRQDFANAQTQFERLAQQNPSGPVAEKALFFAAEAAMSTMGPHSLDRAVELFDKVVQLKGDLRWAARNEQAVIERKLGRPQEALLLYDEVLKNDARPAEKREALCGRGDIYFEMGTEDPKNYDRAVQAYDQLAADVQEPGHWHNQALFKKGVCLEKKADRDGALATFVDILDQPSRPDKPPEFFWFYKAGFNAARLLEDASKWESAATVYEKLVAAGGTRSDEAQARLSRLRLEHFLWQN